MKIKVAMEEEGNGNGDSDDREHSRCHERTKPAMMLLPLAPSAPQDRRHCQPLQMSHQAAYMSLAESKDHRETPIKQAWHPT